MHILYLHQYFVTRNGLGGTRSYEVAKSLTAKGHQVTMVCSGVDNEPRLSVRRGETHRTTTIDGIRCFCLAAGYADGRKGTSMSSWRRMQSFYEFAAAAKRIGDVLPTPDVVFATHTPLTIGLSAVALSRRFDVPFVFEVRDLWPDALIRIGALRNPLAIWWLRKMERKIYRAADHIVALSPGMKDGIVAAGVAPHRVTMIPNGCDLELFHPQIDRTWGREKLGLGDRFAAIYFGAMGMANGLDYLLETAKILKQSGQDHIAIVLHGDGGKRDELMRKVERENLSNVIFSSPVTDKSAVARLVAGCDACLTIYKAAREHTWSPNKMFDALAAGKPVLTNTPGWIGETLESNQCGVSVSPRDPFALATALLQLASRPQSCAQMGANARRLAEGRFAREKLVAQLETVLLQATHGRFERPPEYDRQMPRAA